MGLLRREAHEGGPFPRVAAGFSLTATSKWSRVSVTKLCARPSNGSVVASSTSFDNNYEVITVQVPADETYNLVVTQAGTARTSMTYYGLAWDMFSSNCAGP